jgi:dihydrofolate reductase
MPALRVHCFSMSFDGYGAGADQSEENPLGVGAEGLHEWILETAAGKKMIGSTGGTEGVDCDFVDEGFDNIGSWILGRNMFGPIRGEWGDSDWRGWWGDTPPYHCDVFVLTHHPREPLSMDGGTTFHFTADPIEDVLARAFESAGGKDVRLGGGVATLRQFMQARLVDSLHIPVVPITLGRGERVFEGVDANALGYEVSEVIPSSRVMHVRLTKR